jgi:hypothetical protein
LLIGFLVGWGAMIASTVVAGALMAGASALMSGWNSAFSLIALIGGLLPLASLVGLITWYAMKGKSRSAWGVAAAFASLVALCVLLMAACFGLMSGTNFGR